MIWERYVNVLSPSSLGSSWWGSSTSPTLTSVDQTVSRTLILIYFITPHHSQEFCTATWGKMLKMAFRNGAWSWNICYHRTVITCPFSTFLSVIPLFCFLFLSVSPCHSRQFNLRGIMCCTSPSQKNGRPATYTSSSVPSVRDTCATNTHTRLLIWLVFRGIHSTFTDLHWFSSVS